MALRKPMTPTEIRLFKEAVIRGYQLKHEPRQKNRALNRLIVLVKRTAPLNILVGISACIALVIVEGWRTLLYVFLFSIIWFTLISTVLAAFFIKVK